MLGRFTLFHTTRAAALLNTTTITTFPQLTTPLSLSFFQFREKTTNASKIPTPSARILKKRAAKLLPKETQAGEEVVNMEWLQNNFDGDLEEFEREAEEIVDANLTAYQVCAYNKRKWIKDFASNHDFRRGIVLPARGQIFEEYNAGKE